MTCKCRICGEKLDTETAYKVTIKNKNKYYCSEQEYNEFIKQKEYAQQLKQDIKDIICDIFDIPAIVNTIVYKEWQDWNQLAADEVILNYLQENKTFFRNKIQGMDNTEYNKIKYLSAILKNSLNDFQKSESKVQIKIKDVTIEEYVAKYLDPNLSFKADITAAEKIQLIMDPLFLEDDLIIQAVNNLSYDEFLQTPYWDAVTTYKKEKSNHKCQRCGKTIRLDTHHKTYEHHGQEHNTAIADEDLIVLCRTCHENEHHINDDDEI